ncbi:MAG: FG-GAP-like repeat-containing protein, partial [Bryobacteraceae bacterium]|nr:FG-GAP-like repeat-containing protein [Bryobacteraceae bacterium]
MRTLVALMAVAALCGEAQQSHRDSATRLYREKKFDAAAAELEQHLAAHPEDLSMRLMLGLCRQLSGDKPAAAAVFRDAARRHPKRHQPWFYLARIQFLSGKFDEALSHAGRALELGEGPDRVHNLIGLIYAERNEPGKALAAFDESIRHDPRRATEALLNSGALLLKAGRASEALERLNRALNAQPDSAEAHFHRARALLDLDRAREAEASLVSAVRINNHDGARRLLDQLRSGGVEGNRPQAAREAPPPIRFENAAGAAGIHFVLQHSPTPQKHLLATMPGGVAAFDYDNDGLTDIFFTNGAALPSMKKESARFHNRLYRNQGDWKFQDVTVSAGAAGEGYSMGAAAADYDNDGFVDLFVAGYRRNLLYRNVAGKGFVDVTAKAGIRSPYWAVAAAWLDYDRDGLVDLFVVNYLDWSADRNPY